jgi:hypothetical protein
MSSSPVAFSREFPVYQTSRGIKSALRAGNVVMPAIFIACMAASVVLGSMFLAVITSLLMIPAIVFYVLMVLGTRIMAVADRFNEMNLDGIVKEGFAFPAAGGITLHGYRYHREGLILDPATPIPAIVSFHGLGGHHRELDLYVLPIVKNSNVVYYTFDQRGSSPPHAQGDKNDLRKMDDAASFFSFVCTHPEVDPGRVGVVAMSLGAALALRLLYPDPRARVLVVLSSPVDFVYTLQHMSKLYKFLYALNRYNMAPGKDDASLSPYTVFDKEGIAGVDGRKMENADRIIIACCRDDPLVSWHNTERAIELLGLPPENVLVFETGGHHLVGDETYLAVAISGFIHAHLLA